MLEYLTDFSQQRGARAYPRWAQPPQSKACTALALLNKSLRKKQLSFDSWSLEHKAELMVWVLQSGKEDLRDHLVYFLYQVSVYASEQFILALVSRGIFVAINKLLLAESHQLRYHAALLSSRIYCKRPYAKVEFVKCCGVKLLVTQISRGVLSGAVFRDLLNCLNSLLETDSVPQQEYIALVYKELDHSFLRKIDFSLMTGDVRESFDKLILLLSLCNSLS